MPRKPQRFHNLRRPKIRADWSRWTLYNLSRAREPMWERHTFFDQKWKAKSMARDYHGEYVREGKWQRMFDRRLPAVVPMDGELLAKSDGREASAGRGAGRQTHLPPPEPEPTPYSPMIFWPMERRLDTAVWRALFASSALQARQFVVHGGVKVNGKVLRHPGYLLNPGDMFQVDPQRVMYATGQRKYDKSVADSKRSLFAASSTDKSYDNRLVNAEEEEDAEEGEEVEGKEADLEEAELEDEGEPEVEVAQDPKKALKELMSNAKAILKDPKEKSKMSAKEKQRMRAFSRQVRTTMSRIRGDTVRTPEGEASAQDTVEELERAMADLLAGKSTAGEGEAVAESEAGEEDISPSRDAALLRSALDAATIEDSDDGLEAAAEENDEDDEDEDAEDEDAEYAEDEEDDEQGGRRSTASVTTGVKDASKPYATPWAPREYMSAFAFIPRYLEVNHAICSAVYIRHPVARPGLAEVPTPYSEDLYELAHNWYLRRR